LGQEVIVGKNIGGKTREMTEKMNKKQAMRISDALHRQGGPAEQALRSRCEQEKRARLDVIMECGDPRKWSE
jgi:hypothetical protein